MKFIRLPFTKFVDSPIESPGAAKATCFAWVAAAVWALSPAPTQAQTGPFSPSDWPPTINATAPVDYGIFDPSAAFTTPAGWNSSVSQAGGGDQAFQTITLAGLTGNQQTGNNVNIGDSNFSSWINSPVLDILIEVFGNGALYNSDGTPINTSWLEGTLLSPVNNLTTVNAGPTPLGIQNNQWNWLLLTIANPISSITGQRYVGYLDPSAPGGSANGGVNGGTLRLQNVSGLIVRAVAIGPQGAFGTSNQVNVFAPPTACPAEPTVNLAFVDLNAAVTNNLTILNNGDQTVSAPSKAGPANDKRTAVQATSTYMNFGILNDYLGLPCNLPRTMKVCVEFYDDPALAGASFGPEMYASDDVGDNATYTGPLYTLQGSGQWLRVAFVVPNVDLAGFNTTPLTGGPRLIFNGGFPFVDRAELGVYRTGTNALAGLDPDSTFYLDPMICSTNYANYAELDLQNGISNGIGVGTSGGDQLMVVETAGPANDQRLSERPDGIYNNIQFAILNTVFGPSYQDNARVAQVLTYYDDPAMVGATLYPQVYQSWVSGASTLLFPNQAQVAVTLTGSGKWLDAYFELPDANFNGVNQTPQSLVRYETTPATAGDPTTGYIHVSRVRYAVIRPCGPSAGINLLQASKPIAEYGDTVTGYQDSFTGATRNTNWVAVGPGGDNYVQGNGLLKVFANHGDPNHLVYAAPGYSNGVQEVLARIRIVTFQSADGYRGGIGVCIGTNGSSSPYTNFQGMNFHFRDNTNETKLRHFKLLDDNRAWGPTTFSNDWANNTWYWLRLRQQSKMDGTNTVFAKVWPADWTTPEPASWQLLWPDSSLPTPHHLGLAGLTAASIDAMAQYEVSYVLIKAAGLPNIRVSAAPTAPAMQAPSFLNPAITLVGTNNVSVGWFGQASLVASPDVTGPWTNAPVVSTTNSYVTPKAKLKPEEFYRLRY
jgi:hypothetical protein